MTIDPALEKLALFFGLRMGDIIELSREELIEQYGSTVHPHVLEVVTDPAHRFRYWSVSDKLIVYDPEDMEYMDLVDLRYSRERGLHPITNLDI